MSAAMEAFCIRLRPPDPPIFASTPLEAKNRMLQFRQNCAAFLEYEKLCNLTNEGTTTTWTSSQASSTPDPVVSRVTTLQTVTSDITNVSSVNNDTFPTPITDLEDHIRTLTTSSGSSAWIAAVVIAILVILVIAVIVLVKIYKKKKRNVSQHLCDLQSHERVNYLNNKAAKGEKWAGVHENVNYLDNKAEKGQKWTGSTVNTDKRHWDKSNNQSRAHSANVNVHDITELNELSMKNGHNLTNHSKQTSASKDKTADEVIYANSQFVKVAKAAGKKPPLEKTPSVRDITPPADKKTQDMYYIDENPYDRVDRREKPVPKKRNKVMHQEPR
uniref:Uncharacterized protein LOC111127744 isoform X1 n=1 Tax=Crassostrea virginica TaxID=6565 RepID=A0A8B8DLQ9_CRAVI|nr:uncharacterized protein LOC111127744 isoform X1 [Crassostrea virginica]XP_022328689.1 uncharacterized protein LOC111127744 isoform X1 [Crassostrea virginica]XP_022328690.1 uncharacterized protein LOC111127744 isoform X1 [Crassostrea virginica]